MVYGGDDRGGVVVWDHAGKEILCNNDIRTPIASMCLQVDFIQSQLFVGATGSIYVFNTAQLPHVIQHNQPWHWIRVIHTPVSLPICCLTVVCNDIWCAANNSLLVYNVSTFDLQGTPESALSDIFCILPLMINNDTHVWIGGAGQCVNILSRSSKQRFKIRSRFPLPRGANQIVHMIQLYVNAVASVDDMGNVLAWNIA